MYLNEKFSEDLAFPKKIEGDFFPYRDGAHSFWTGFYTSRVALKGRIRDENKLL